MRAARTYLSIGFLFLAVTIIAGDTEVSNELPDEIKNLDKKKLLRPAEPRDFEYPKEANTSKVFSDVWVKFKVIEDGRAKELSIVYCDTPNNGFESAALKTVTGSTYPVKTNVRRRKRTIDKSWFYTKVRFHRNLDRIHLFSDSTIFGINEDNPLCPDYLAVMPEIIYKHVPAYPKKALLDDVSENVLVRILVDKEGNASRVLLADSSNTSDQYGLKEAALSSARKCKFRPMICDGLPVKCWVSFPYEFIIYKE